MSTARLDLPVVAPPVAHAPRTVAPELPSALAIDVRRATLLDVAAIHALQADFVTQRILLARTPDQIRAAIDRYVVAVAGERIIGCGMLKLYSPELAEICALAVAPDCQQHGMGRRIVERLLDDAAALGLTRVIALTLQPGFFHRLGFETTTLRRLPEKVAADCRACPKRHACDEVAVVREVAPMFSNRRRS